MIKLLGYGWESNVYLILDEKVAVIDAGTGFESLNLVREIEKYTPEIDYIILTHEHFDHAGGAPALRRYFGAKIVMHWRGSRILERGEDVYSRFFNAQQEKSVVDIKVRGGERIELGENILEVIYTPGHSMGSICLYEASKKMLFSGDTVFLYGGVGRTDFYGGDTHLLKNSIKKLSEIDVRKIYPGHGEYDEENGNMHIKMAMEMLNLL